MKKILKNFKFATEALLTLLAYIFIPGWLFIVNAQSQNLEVEGVNFNPIRIPLFLPLNPNFASSMTVFSWLSFIGGLATIGLVIFWIYLILRTAIKAMQSRGETEGLVDVSKRFKSIFIGMFLTFLFPVILSIIGVFIGIGSIFSWPKMFSQCIGDLGSYQYYYQAYLEEGEASADSICDIGNALTGK